jgi:hypothetical protein
LDSYWAEGTVWPVSPGAADRAAQLELERKAQEGTDVPLVVLPPKLPTAPASPTDEDADEAFWSPAF